MGHRSKAAAWSLEHPDLLDASVSYKSEHPCISRWPTLKGQIPGREYYTQYQTVVILGGIGAAFRTGRHLSAGQAVIMQDFEYEEWFLPYMTPYENYIPLRRDLSDLRQVMEWVRDHPNEVRTIAERGKQFYLDWMSHEETENHWYELLWRLAELIRDNKGTNRTNPEMNRTDGESLRDIWPHPLVPKTFLRDPSAASGWIEVEVDDPDASNFTNMRQLRPPRRRFSYR